MNSLITKNGTLISAIIFALSLTGCDGLGILSKNITKLGYIYNAIPLERGGPGTLVGGTPHKLQIISDSQTCFPTSVDGISTNLYKESDADVADIQTSWNFSADVAAKAADFLSNGNPMLKINAGYENLGKVSLKMRGVKVDYIDAVDLIDFYDKKLTPTCKRFLESYGVIMQALRVAQLEFTFYDKNGGEINLDVGNLGKLVSLGANVKFDVEHGTSLVIDSPRYIGYQLGKLQQADQGIALYRSTKVSIDGAYLFQANNLFGSN